MKSLILQICDTWKLACSSDYSAECDLPMKSCDQMKECDPGMCEQKSWMSYIFLLYLAVATSLWLLCPVLASV